MASFIKDVEEIRQRAIEKIEDGPVTATYKGDKKRTVEILNEALATEIVCVLRYMHHYFMATGVNGRAVADEFKEHADAEREHAEELAERIQQLGGKPDFNPASLLQRSAAQYIEGESLADMIREDLIAERIVIEVYQEMIRHFGDNDPTTRTLLEHILSEEEEHAADLSDLLYVVDPRTGETEGKDPGTDPLHMAGTATQQEEQGKSGGSPADTGREEESPGSSQGGAEVRTRLSQGERHPNPKADVRGRDRQYDGMQEVTPPNRPQPGQQKNRGAKSTVAYREGKPAASVPGTGGRTMNRRKTNDEADFDEVAEKPNRGAMSGGTRTPKIIQKNRKNKRVA